MRIAAEGTLECGAQLRLYTVGTGVTIEVVDDMNFVRASFEDPTMQPKENRFYPKKHRYMDRFNHVSIFAENPQDLYDMLKGATEMLAQIVKKP